MPDDNVTERGFMEMTPSERRAKGRVFTVPMNHETDLHSRILKTALERWTANGCPGLPDSSNKLAPPEADDATSSRQSSPAAENKTLAE